jgi:hypothetical protein
LINQAKIGERLHNASTVTMIFLKAFSYFYVKLLLAICKYRHTPLPKQPGNSGNVLSLTFAVQCRNTPVIIAATSEDEQVWIGIFFLALCFGLWMSYKWAWTG